MQRFTAHMPLLTATSTFRSGEDAGVLLDCVIYTVSVPQFLSYIMAENTFVCVIVIIFILLCVMCCLQCFDAVGWVAGRASGL